MDSEERLWFDVVDIVEKHWKSRANSRPVIEIIFDSWIELKNEIERQKNKIREKRDDNSNLECEIKELRKTIIQKDELIDNLTKRIKDLEEKQKVEMTKIKKTIDKRQVEKKLDIHNRRLWD